VRPISDEIRAQALADLQAGCTVTDVSMRYDLGKATVSRLKNELGPETLEQIGTNRIETIGELVEKHLRASLKAATSVANQCNDRRWIEKQSAKDLAVFYGVVSDKAIRVLEASERARDKHEADSTNTAAA